MSDPVHRRLAASVASLDTRTRLAILGGVTAVFIWLVSTTIFPYHSVNHDEGVYLQQAAMLLDGKLYLTPPVEDAFRPWFFVDSSAGLYSKYNPPTAALFAVGKLLGSFRIALVLIAAGAVVLLQRVVAMVFDEVTGYVAAIALVASPLFLVDAAVFLPYVPTMFLNLAFAAAYLRADLSGDSRLAAIAGLAIGLAFFARPYTAVLFAAPFVAHALWMMRSLDRDPLRRNLLTAATGLLGVGAALGYNAVVTGDPLVFPYQAFAPLDGLGFGRRELLGYAIDYTPALAVRANAEALFLFATRWVVAGALGTLLAVIGVVVTLRRGIGARQATILGLFVSVPVGNLYFWGTLNTLGDLSEPGDGLGHFLGPYYYVDLLVPTTVFLAVGLLACLRYGRTIVDRYGPDSERRRRVAVASLIVLGTVVGAGATVTAAAGPLGDNAEATDQLGAAYEPFEDRSFENGLVFLPTPHGDWLNHPFQALRNDPGYDGEVVYALQERQFEVVDAFPNRTLYRYSYRGAWTPRRGDAVTPRLTRIQSVTGERVTTEVTLGSPEYGERLGVTLSADGGTNYTSVPIDDEETRLTITVEDDTARLSIDGDSANASVPIGDRDRIGVTAFVDSGTGTGMSYGVELPVERTGTELQALSPSLEVCQGVHLCGGEAAYIPGAHGPGISMNATVRAD